MSFTIGIYDLFAYTIPGLLYLFVINEFLQTVGSPHLQSSDFLNLPSGVGLAALAAILVAAHLLGHLLDPVAQRLIDIIPNRKKPSQAALDRLKERYPSVDIQFAARDWSLLFSLLRQRNLESSKIVDTYQADCIMFRNLFTGLLVSVILQIANLARGYNPITLVGALFTACLSILAATRSRMFNIWFFTGIFEASLHYGNSLAAVLSYGHTELRTPRQASASVRRPTPTTQARRNGGK